MIKPIVKDVLFLGRKSVPATAEDMNVVDDLVDTFCDHVGHCVGMAANMIGVSKRIIVFDDNGKLMIMLNPEIVKQSEPYRTEEGCLSLEGTRPCKRYKSIKVRYQNEAMQTRLKTYTGYTAQIIQHEIDHCDGIII